MMSLVDNFVHNKNKPPEVFRDYLFSALHCIVAIPALHVNTTCGQRAVSFKSVSLLNNKPAHVRQTSH